MTFSITQRLDGDTFDAGVYNGDRQEIVDFIESDIEDAILAAKQAIDPSVSTWDDSSITGPLGWANVVSFGADPTGVEDSITAIKAARDSLTAGGTLYFPAGTYLVSSHVGINVSNTTVRGAGMGASIIKAIAGVNTALGALSLGYGNSTSASATSNLTVVDISLDGNDICRPIQGRSVTNVLILRVLCENSSRAPAQFFESTDVTVAYCTLQDSNAADEYGDGLYFGGCTRPKALFNKIYDFKRIGIVTESDSSKSSDVLIMGNEVHYGHDNTYPEHNAGIWCENTNGGTIIGNHLFDLTNNSAVGADSRGIHIDSGSTTNSTFLLSGNTIRDATRGINIQTSSGNRVIIKDNSITGTYTYGINIASSGVYTHVENNFFEGTTISGLIVISAAGENVGDVYIGPNGKGTMTYATVAAADIYCFDYGTMPTLTLNGLGPNWKLTFDTLPPICYMNNCSFLLDPTNASNHGFGATNTLKASGCSFGINDTFSSSHLSMRSAVGAYYTFDNCTFTGILGRPIHNHASGMTTEFFNCNFTDCQFLVDGTGIVFLRNSQIYSYPATGMFRGNSNSGTVEFHVNDCWITNASDVKCFVKVTNDLDVFIMHDVTYNNTTISSALYDWTPNDGSYTTISVP